MVLKLLNGLHNGQNYFSLSGPVPVVTAGTGEVRSFVMTGDGAEFYVHFRDRRAYLVDYGYLEPEDYRLIKHC